MYARHMPELRDIAEPILRSVLEEDTELRWIQGMGSGRGKVEIKPLVEGEVED